MFFMEQIDVGHIGQRVSMGFCYIIPKNSAKKDAYLQLLRAEKGVIRDHKLEQRCMFKIRVPRRRRPVVSKGKSREKLKPMILSLTAEFQLKDGRRFNANSSSEF